MVTFHDLPRELIQEAAKYLSLCDIRSLRLTSRTLYDGSSSLFRFRYFRDIHVFFTRIGLHKLLIMSQHRDLSGNLVLSQNIRSLSLHQGVFDDMEDGLVYPEVPLPPGCSKERMQETCKMMWKVHKDMEAQGLYDTWLKEALKEMPALDSIHIVNGNSHPTLPSPLDAIPTADPQLPGIQFWPRRETRISSTTFCFTKVLNALTTSPASIRVLRVREDENWCVRPDIGEIDVHKIRLAEHCFSKDGLPRIFRGLEELSVRFVSRGMSQSLLEYRRLRGSNNIHQLFAMMPSMQALELGGFEPKDTDFVSIFQAISQNIVFSRLQSLKLRKACILTEDLLAFFKNHASTLEYIDFDLVVLPENGWATCLRTLSRCETEMPNLRGVRAPWVFESRLCWNPQTGTYDRGPSTTMVTYSNLPGGGRPRIWFDSAGKEQRDQMQISREISQRVQLWLNHMDLRIH